VTRIIGGAARGRRLRTPRGDRTRPTADRVREALFSSLESDLGTLSGTRFLDLFAGSGAVGLEAASRGASSVVLVESDRPTAALITQNARALQLSDVEISVQPRRVEAWLHERADGAGARDPDGKPTEVFDVVYVDPPYTQTASDLTPLVRQLSTARLLSTDARVVVERSGHADDWRWPEGFEALREKKYGETILFFGRPAPVDQSGPDSAATVG
jgi:16S rRNA (guanine966-N2)-methyltransferase